MFSAQEQVQAIREFWNFAGGRSASLGPLPMACRLRGSGNHGLEHGLTSDVRLSFGGTPRFSVDPFAGTWPPPAWSPPDLWRRRGAGGGVRGEAALPRPALRGGRPLAGGAVPLHTQPGAPNRSGSDASDDVDPGDRGKAHVSEIFRDLNLIITFWGGWVPFLCGKPKVGRPFVGPTRWEVGAQDGWVGLVF